MRSSHDMHDYHHLLKTRKPGVHALRVHAIPKPHDIVFVLRRSDGLEGSINRMEILANEEPLEPFSSEAMKSLSLLELWSD